MTADEFAAWCEGEGKGCVGIVKRADARNDQSKEKRRADNTLSLSLTRPNTSASASAIVDAKAKLDSLQPKFVDHEHAVEMKDITEVMLDLMTDTDLNNLCYNYNRHRKTGSSRAPSCFQKKDLKKAFFLQFLF
jgi:hypothetical protein